MGLFASPHVDGLTVLAIDPGRKLGWAVRRGDGETRHGVEPLPGPPTQWRAFVGFLNRLNDRSAHRITDLYIEKSQWRGDRRFALAMLSHGGFLAHAEHWCDVNHVRYGWAAPNSVKKYMADNGRAGKDDVQFYLRAQGFDFKDDNESDAIALLDYALADLARARMLERAS